MTSSEKREKDELKYYTVRFIVNAHLIGGGVRGYCHIVVLLKVCALRDRVGLWRFKTLNSSAWMPSGTKTNSMLDAYLRMLQKQKKGPVHTMFGLCVSWTGRHFSGLYLKLSIYLRLLWVSNTTTIFHSLGTPLSEIYESTPRTSSDQGFYSGVHYISNYCMHCL